MAIAINLKQFLIPGVALHITDKSWAYLEPQWIEKAKSAVSDIRSGRVPEQC